jgi:hypothetical protein
MQHLTEQELVLHHYHDDESPAAIAEHLNSCDVCRAEYNSIRRVLALVDELPVPERNDGYGEQVWSRLRWKLGNDRYRRRSWQTALAAAAVLAVAFFAGALWHARNSAIAPVRPAGQAALPVLKKPDSHDRVLLVVVTDHLDSSERMLTEVANADAKHGIDLGDEQKRAEELVASNRIYRQTALQHGDDRLATLLADIEPVLLEIAHSDGKLSPDEAAALQKRIDSKGLLFKVRVITAQKGMTSI